MRRLIVFRVIKRGAYRGELLLWWMLIFLRAANIMDGGPRFINHNETITAIAIIPVLMLLLILPFRGLFLNGRLEWFFWSSWLFFESWIIFFEVWGNIDLIFFFLVITLRRLPFERIILVAIWIISKHFYFSLFFLFLVIKWVIALDIIIRRFREGVCTSPSLILLPLGLLVKRSNLPCLERLLLLQ